MMPSLEVLKKYPGCKVVRPDIAGIMGAFGAALIARERYEENQTSSMLSTDEINALTFDTELTRCQGCTNHCLLTVNHFSGGRKYITGNRCEKGLGEVKKNTRMFQTSLLISNRRMFDLPAAFERRSRPWYCRHSTRIEYV